MKKSLSKITLSFILVLSIFVIQAFTSPNTVVEVSLQNAISNHTITAEINSTGGYSINSIELSLNNNSNKKITVKIPAGTLYHPEDNGEQTLIQLEDEFFVLNPHENKSGEISAFCSESNDRCPTSGSTMDLAATDDSKMKEMIAYLKGKHVSPENYQNAVWAISDNHSISNIFADTEEDKSFRTFVASLTGQKDTWYSSGNDVQVDEYGNFNFETVKIEGDLEFDCKKGAHIYQDLYRADGTAVYESQKYFTPQTTHLNYWFKVKVTGWEKGGYYIKVHDGTNTLATFDFEV